MIDIVRITDIMKANQRKETNSMADLKIVQNSWTAPDGKQIETYYLESEVHGQKVTFKISTPSPNDKQLLQALTTPSVKK